MHEATPDLTQLHTTVSEPVFVQTIPPAAPPIPPSRTLSHPPPSLSLRTLAGLLKNTDHNYTRLCYCRPSEPTQHVQTGTISAVGQNGIDNVHYKSTRVPLIIGMNSRDTTAAPEWRMLTWAKFQQ